MCTHVLIALACERETREALVELAAATCAPVAPVATYTTDQDAATVARVQAACEGPAKVSKAKANTPKGFSLLKV